MTTVKQFKRGSEWRKWDLHVHAPLGMQYSGYQTEDGTDVLDAFCDVVENSDVQVYGIAEYFSFESFKSFIERFNIRYPESHKCFFFNLELRLNESVNKELEEVNTHLIFNPDSFGKVEKFLSNLYIVKTGRDGAPISCTDLKTPDDFKSASVTRDAISEAFEITFGKKASRNDHFFVVTAANNDGLRPLRGKKRKEGISDEIDKFSDAFFGGLQNIEYYQKTDRLEDKELKVPPKPVLACSDAHTFKEFNDYVGKRVTNEETQIIHKDVTWIKADTTFEGLKQITYETVPGERVSLGPLMPNLKEGYKVISKLKIEDPDFPDEILFNGNMCSIIGSRSSGKSALLAYLAHSVDPILTEELTKGPGEGEDFHWEKIKTGHSVEWQNQKSNEDSPGKIVYAPQNYLFDKSKDASEIKKKIEPVLFRTLPSFSARFEQVERDIQACNQTIQAQTERWFELSKTLDTLIEQIKNIGDQKAIGSEKIDVEKEIEIFKKEHRLSDEDLTKYKEISENLSKLGGRKKQIDIELRKMLVVSKDRGYFDGVTTILSPALESLPGDIRNSIKSYLNATEQEVLQTINARVLKYKNEILAEEKRVLKEIAKINTDNDALIKKHQKNIELQALVQRSTTLSESLNKILVKVEDQRSVRTQITECKEIITVKIEKRKTYLDDLVNSMKEEKQDHGLGIKFGVECDWGLNLEAVSSRVNMRERTDFVWDTELQIDAIREKPGEFLSAVHYGRQKVISHNKKEDVARDVLALTEKILFTAEMEGDRIGGFSESTMSPGKRALFALRLILMESGDTWPLLIDQPEDDLDSRSIYDEVVPFLKTKKKERQIIMVSHDANLVIGSDSEQVIIANRHANDRRNEDNKEFNYFTGSLEYSQKKDETCEDTLNSQGVCEHTCEILDGGRVAFESRKNKYNIK
jgi:hypothetical protein